MSVLKLQAKETLSVLKLQAKERLFHSGWLEAQSSPSILIQFLWICEFAVEEYLCDKHTVSMCCHGRAWRQDGAREGDTSAWFFRSFSNPLCRYHLSVLTRKLPGVVIVSTWRWAKQSSEACSSSQNQVFRQPGEGEVWGHPSPAAHSA